MNKQRLQEKNERNPQLLRKKESKQEQEPTNVELAVENALAQRVELIKKEFQIQEDSLDLSHSQIDDLDVLNIGILLTDQSQPSLVHLNLSHNKITAEGLFELLIPIQFQVNLKELYLNHNEIGQASEGLAAVLPVLQELRILGLGNCGLVDEDITQICLGIVHLENLVELQLHNNQFGNEGVTMLCASVLCVLGLIERLYLGGNQKLSKEGFVCLFECLHNNTRLKSLFVNDIALCDESIAALGNTLVYNHSLTTISLANCGIDDTQMNLLQLALASNKTLTNLYLWGNHLTESSLVFLGPFVNKQKNQQQQKVVLLHDNDFGSPQMIDQISQSQCQNSESIKNNKDTDKDHEQHKSISIDNFSFFGQKNQESQVVYSEQPFVQEEIKISSKIAEKPSQEINMWNYITQQEVDVQDSRMKMKDSRYQKKLEQNWMKQNEQLTEKEDPSRLHMKREAENIIQQQSMNINQEYYQNNQPEGEERNLNYEDDEDEDEELDDYYLNGGIMMNENEEEENGDEDDDRDERELCKLEKQLAQDLEIVQKNKESAKRDEKNTQFWKGFEKDQRSGLLKSQLS